MKLSVFDLFIIGIGPSSSHTVGPMRDSHCALMANIFVSLDRVVKTMLDTGRDMQDKYKETARWPGSKRDRMLSDRCKRGLQT